ncbi:MAG: photosynthetic complex assembly protein PuhC [Hyphomicrobiales bacterium]|nr:photosynthetic complex assembly protein PuhC [Hyphomicrobiales bacterium]
MTDTKKKPPFPTLPLYAVGALLAFTIMVVIAARLGGIEPTFKTDAEVVQTREILLKDLPGGGISVQDATTGAVIDEIPPGANGFIRVAMRSIARQRRLNKVGLEPPVRLVALSDNSVMLEDPSTGLRINLRAFGEGNARSIAYLISEKGKSQ